MGASPGGDQATPTPGLLAGLSLPSGPGLADGTTQPGVPVTSGAATGPGAGPEALGLPDQQGQDVQQLLRYLPVFEFMANQPNSSAAGRNMVRWLKGQQ